MNEHPSSASVQLPPTIDNLFKRLCRPATSAEITGLRADLAAYRNAITAAVHSNEFIDLRLAGKIADAVDHLLADYDGYSAEQQQLIIGAVRYFIHSDDEDHDLTSLFGFEDDLLVINAVLTALGQETIDP